MRRVALMLYGKWGDTIVSTTVPYNIKKQTDWHITFYTSPRYGKALYNNPYIDEIKYINSGGRSCSNPIHRRNHGHAHIPAPSLRCVECAEITRAEVDQDGNYDVITIPITEDTGRWTPLGFSAHQCWMWGAARCVEDLGLKFIRPFKTILRPTAEEYERVSKFIDGLNLTSNTKCFMMEGGPLSMQSWWTPVWPYEITKWLIARYPDCKVFLSQGDPIYEPITQLVVDYPLQFFYMNELSQREISILFNYCHAFFSFSSGTANTCQTDLCKRNLYWFEAVRTPVMGSVPMSGYTAKHCFVSKNPIKYLQFIDARLPLEL